MHMGPLMNVRRIELENIWLEARSGLTRSA
jgi:hypothetical protein